MKKCPLCAEQIQDAATFCRHCRNPVTGVGQLGAPNNGLARFWTAKDLGAKLGMSERSVQQITELHGKWFRVPGKRAAVIDEADVEAFLAECKDGRRL